MLDELLVILFPPLHVVFLKFVDKLVIDAPQQRSEVNGGNGQDFFLDFPEVLGIQRGVPKPYQILICYRFDKIVDCCLGLCPIVLALEFSNFVPEIEQEFVLLGFDQASLDVLFKFGVEGLRVSEAQGLEVQKAASGRGNDQGLRNLI